MVAITAKVPIEVLAEFCQRHHITRLALFGSMIRGDYTPESDIDVLVDFEPHHVPGLAIIDMADELTQLFGGRRVDLVTRKSINHRLRQSIEDSAVVLYEE